MRRRLFFALVAASAVALALIATSAVAAATPFTASVVGQATPTTPGMISVVEVYTVTGGTGRFVHTTGTFTLHSTENQATGVSSGTLSGSIVLH